MYLSRVSLEHSWVREANLKWKSVMHLPYRTAKVKIHGKFIWMPNTIGVC